MMLLLSLWNKKTDKSKGSRFFCLLCLGLLSAPALAGCAAGFAASSLGDLGYFYNEKINLADLNYAAADMLSQNAKISTSTPLVLGRLKNKSNPGSDVPFNTVILEQVGTRLLQLGYDIKMRQDGDDFVFDGPENSNDFSRRDVLLTGSYTPGSREYFVSLRLIRLRDSTLLGAYDYTIPVTRETREMGYTQHNGRSWLDLP